MAIDAFVQQDPQALMTAQERRAEKKRALQERFKDQGASRDRENQTAFRRPRREGAAVSIRRGRTGRGTRV
jgi:hypothetical protein